MRGRKAEGYLVVTYRIILQRCSSIRGAAAVTSIRFLLLHNLSAAADARGLKTYGYPSTSSSHTIITHLIV